MSALTSTDPSVQPLDRRLLHVELVDDLADQLLDEVLEGDEPGGAAVLVDDDRQVELLLLHLAHEVRHPLGLRHELGRPHAVSHRLAALARPLGTAIRSLA